MNHENITEELDKLIERIKELGTQSEQFSKTREILSDAIEANKKLSEDYSSTLKKCDSYIDSIISSFDENVYSEFSKQIENSKQILDECINKNRIITEELEESQNILKETISSFKDENKKNSNDIVVKIESVNANLNSANESTNTILENLKQTLDECIQKNRVMAEKLEQGQNNLKETICLFRDENKKNSDEMIVKIESVNADLNSTNISTNSILESLKQIIIEKNKSDEINFNIFSEKMDKINKNEKKRFVFTSIMLLVSLFLLFAILILMIIN